MCTKDIKAYSQCFQCVLQPSRNAIVDETRRWKFPIPYILTDSLGTRCTMEVLSTNKSFDEYVKHALIWKFVSIILELNAKGVILQAFEEYRLRSCVDFKPYEGEASYISFTKLSG